MSNAYRRYEILLPLKFNDGRPIPDELIGTTLLELRTRFGAISLETQTIHRTWSYLGEEYRRERGVKSNWPRMKHGLNTEEKEGNR